jgi:hypothetical protein
MILGLVEAYRRLRKLGALKEPKNDYHTRQFPPNSHSETLWIESFSCPWRLALLSASFRTTRDREQSKFRGYGAINVYGSDSQVP